MSTSRARTGHFPRVSCRAARAHVSPDGIAVLVSIAVVWGTATCVLAQDGTSSQARGKHGVVAAGRQTAVDAGMEILRQGGNAVDAAVATIFVQTVVESRSVCFGGEVPIIIFDAKKQEVFVLNGMGAAPKMANAAWFREHKNGKIPRDDPTAAAVPSLLHTCLTALEQFGTLRFADVVQPMLRMLDTDEPRWKGELARNLRLAIDAEQKAPDRRAGMEAARDYFYRGPVARDLDEWSQKNGGLLRYDDLANHQTMIESSARTDYRGYTVHKCGTWTQGPFLLQTLKLLESFDLKAMGPNRADYVHTVTEAMKLTLADRDTYYGDPRHVAVPLDALLSGKYADIRRPLIDRLHASRELLPGDPRAGRPKLGMAPSDYTTTSAPARDTTTCLVADSWGNVVAATPSGWSGVVAGQTGIVLGSRLISFNLWEGHPNCIAPGKRPRITLTPTVVCQEGKPVLAISVAGGDLQDQTTLQVLLNVIEFGMPLVEAVTAPRFSTAHHVNSFNQTAPELGSLTVHRDVGDEVVAELKTRGHDVKTSRGAIGAPVIITVNGGDLSAAGDPQAGRHVGAY